MAGALEEIQQQIDQHTAAINKLNEQRIVRAGDVTRSTNALDTKNNHCHEKTTRESGYVNWDESHDSIKNMRWMTSSLFRRRILGIEKIYNRTFPWPVNEDSDCEIINENTRFPENQELYVNVRDPKIQYVLQHYNHMFKANNGYDNDYKLLTFIENHLHTRSSFEEKYNLIWVDPKKQNS